MHACSRRMRPSLVVATSNSIKAAVAARDAAARSTDGMHFPSGGLLNSINRRRKIEAGGLPSVPTTRRSLLDARLAASCKKSEDAWPRENRARCIRSPRVADEII